MPGSLVECLDFQHRKDGFVVLIQTTETRYLLLIARNILFNKSKILLTLFYFWVLWRWLYFKKRPYFWYGRLHFLLKGAPSSLLIFYFYFFFNLNLNLECIKSVRQIWIWLFVIHLWVLNLFYFIFIFWFLYCFWKWTHFSIFHILLFD